MIDTKNLAAHVLGRAEAAKEASRKLAVLTGAEKDDALLALARALEEDEDAVLAANAQDVHAATLAGLPQSKIDRLALTRERLAGMRKGLGQVAALPDPVGVSLATFERPNGLRIERRSTPMGVIAIIYEARPNVTVDAASLALKAGSAVVLRGGREALRSNAALVASLRRGLRATAVPEDAVQLVEMTEHETVDLLIGARGLVDLAIPRGGEDLIRRVVDHARVPVIETGVGNCHTYVDAAADPDKALAIAVNAKVQRPSVCNAMETLLVHAALTESWLPKAVQTLQEVGVEIRGCETTRAAVRDGSVLPATEADWGREFLDLILAVKVVSSIDEAMAHIARYGSGHSEAIVTEDEAAARRFLDTVDSAAVYHNASTRFTDGFEFGFGAEMGISTQKLHARGPLGLMELTSFKYVVRGDGQIRV